MKFWTKRVMNDRITVLLDRDGDVRVEMSDEDSYVDLYLMTHEVVELRDFLSEAIDAPKGSSEGPA